MSLLRSRYSHYHFEVTENCVSLCNVLYSLSKGKITDIGSLTYCVNYCRGRVYRGILRTSRNESRHNRGC